MKHKKIFASIIIIILLCSVNMIFTTTSTEINELNDYYHFSRKPSTIQNIVTNTSIKIKYKSQDEAIVDIGNYLGSLAISGHEVKLKKILGKWVVVEFKMTFMT